MHLSNRQQGWMRKKCIYRVNIVLFLPPPLDINEQSSYTLSMSPTDKVEPKLPYCRSRSTNAAVIFCVAGKCGLHTSCCTEVIPMYLNLPTCWSARPLQRQGGAGISWAANTMVCVFTTQIIIPIASQNAAAASLSLCGSPGLLVNNTKSSA